MPMNEFNKCHPSPITIFLNSNTCGLKTNIAIISYPHVLYYGNM